MKKFNTKFNLVSAVLLSLATTAVFATESRLVKKPARAEAKPDLIIYYVNSYYPVDDTIKVTVRNNGNAKAGSNVVRVNVSGMVAEASIPSLEPNHAAEREVKFSKPLKKGAKMRVTVDSKKHVAESNETNNTKAHTY